MPPEVISLLSSPEPDPLPAKAPARTSKTLGGFGQVVANQTSAALYGALDCIPESSNPGPSAQPRDDDWWFSSGDFDVTGDLEGGDHNQGAPFLDSRPSKRRRLSGSPFGSPVSSKATSNLTKPVASASILPCATAPRSPPRASRQAPADVVELLSSPIGSPVIPERRAIATAKVDTFVDGGLSDSSISNPFLSSSPLPRQTKGPLAPTTANGKEKEVPSGDRPRFSPKKSVVWDPISSSAPASNGGRSSPPPPRPLQRSRSDVIAIVDSDLELSSDGSSDDEFPDDLAKIKAMKSKRRAGAASSKPRSKPSKPASSRPRASAGAPKKSAEEREAERARKRLEQDLATEAAKREKELERERRAQEKKQAAALAEVNKIRTDKKVSTPEMLVDLPDSLPETTRLQAELLLHDLEVDFHPWTSPVENVVKWRRKVRARYNDELGHWEPVPMIVQDEKHAMAVLTASQFVDLVVADDANNNGPDPPEGAEGLSAHVAAMKLHFPSHTLIYLIEGLNPWLRKNRIVRDRHFQAAVRSALVPPPETEPSSAAAAAASNPPRPHSPPPTSRRKKAGKAAATAAYVDADLIEDALLGLQVRHGALIQHTAAALSTARQIAVFTQHLSTLPYRRVRDAAASAAAGFCMDVGQVRTGDGPRDTYARMLQEIARVTAPIAYGVAAEFGSVAALMRGLEEGGPLRLEDVRRCADRDGTAGERRVGQAVSRRVWKVFTGRDEASMDI